MNNQTSAKIKVVLLLAGFVVGILVGVNISGGGFLTSTTYPLDVSEAGEHTHTQLDVFASPPQVDLELKEEATGKYTLHIQTENFAFAPERTGTEHVDSEGHAHVYVDGVKISRAYGPWYDLPKLKPGEHTIRVTLNTNDHQEYAAHGDIISAEASVMVATSSEMIEME